MKVYVKSQSGKWLMPTNPANARILLKQGKAKVIQGRKTPNRTQKRNNKNVFTLKGFNRWDTVQYKGRVGFISGFTGSSSCYIVDIKGNYIKNPMKTYKQVDLREISLICKNQTIISQ